jgi:hypothetical protein
VRSAGLEVWEVVCVEHEHATAKVRRTSSIGRRSSLSTYLGELDFRTLDAGLVSIRMVGQSGPLLIDEVVSVR